MCGIYIEQTVIERREGIGRNPGKDVTLQVHEREREKNKATRKEVGGGSPKKMITAKKKRLNARAKKKKPKL